MLNIILVSKYLRAPRKFNLHDRRTALVFGGAVLAVLAMVFLMGIAASRAVGGLQLSHLQQRVAEQDRQLIEIKAENQRDMNAMALRLAELQAQANRLNALGIRLTRDSKLAGGEFDFEKTPGAGGAEDAEDVSAADLNSNLKQVRAEFESSSRQLSVLESMLFEQELELKSQPTTRPTDSYVTSDFGYRMHPVLGGRAHHNGIDFEANIGDPVRSAGNGLIKFAGWKTGFGNVVEIDHQNGYVTVYAHNSAFTVKEGDVVRAGQVVAKAGSTGRSTGPHVHFEVHKDGRPVNPRAFLDKSRG
jgi:murein DD-endopeptidase MepM/ murein hydrolase activator NlpD